MSGAAENELAMKVDVHGREMTVAEIIEALPPKETGCSFEEAWERFGGGYPVGWGLMPVASVAMAPDNSLLVELQIAKGDRVMTMSYEGYRRLRGSRIPLTPPAIEVGHAVGIGYNDQDREMLALGVLGKTDEHYLLHSSVPQARISPDTFPAERVNFHTDVGHIVWTERGGLGTSVMNLLEEPMYEGVFSVRGIKPPSVEPDRS